jgi:hypothetical protein
MLVYNTTIAIDEQALICVSTVPEHRGEARQLPSCEHPSLPTHFSFSVLGGSRLLSGSGGTQVFAVTAKTMERI